MAGILDSVKADLEKMSPDELRAEYQKMLEGEQARKAKQAERNSDPEVLAKRKAYSISYREKVMADPAKAAAIIEKRKAYMQRPEIKDRQKAYRDKRNAALKAIKERAIALGIADAKGNLIAPSA